MVTEQQQLKLAKIKNLLTENRWLVWIEVLTIAVQIFITLIFPVVKPPYTWAFPMFVTGCFIKTILNRRRINKLLKEV